MRSDQPNFSAQIAKMIAEAEQAAFVRGWDEAVATMIGALEKAHPRQPEAKRTPFADAAIEKKARGKKRKKRRPVLKNDGPSQARAIVLAAIKENPGRLGSEIAMMVAKSVNKHTVRTQIRKLRLAGEITQDSKLRWHVPTEYRQAS